MRERAQVCAAARRNIVSSRWFVPRRLLCVHIHTKLSNLVGRIGGANDFIVLLVISLAQAHLSISPLSLHADDAQFNSEKAGDVTSVGRRAAGCNVHINS